MDVKKKVKYWIGAGLVGFSLFLTGLFVWQAFLRQESAGLLVRAEKYYRSGDFVKAEKALSVVLREDSLNEAALRILAEIYEKKEYFNQAAAVRGRLISVNPLDPDLVLRYVRLLNLMQKYDETMKFLKNRERESGVSSDAEKLEYCVAELAASGLPAAEKTFGNIVRGNVDPVRYDLLRGWLFIAKGRTNDALKIFRRYQDNENREIRFFANLYTASLAKSPAEKEKAWRTCADSYVSFGLSLLADYLISEGRFADAARELEKIDSSRRSFMMVCQLAEVYASLGDGKKIEAMIPELRVRFRQEIILKYYLESIASFVAKKYPETLSNLNNCREFAMRALYLYMKLQSEIATDSPVSTVLGTAGEIKNLRGSSMRTALAPVMENYMKRLYTKKKWNELVACGKFVIDEQWSTPVVEDMVLLGCFRTGEKPPFGLPEKVLKRSPENTTALILLAGAETGKGRFTEARRYLSRVLKKHPGSESAVMMLASVEERSGNRARALELLRGGLSRHPDSVSAADSLFSFLLRTDRKSAAKFIADSVNSKSPVLKKRTALYAGVLAQKENDSASAKKYFEKALEAEKKLPGIYLSLADLEKSPEKQEKILREGLKNNPENVAFGMRIAQIAASQGRDREAAGIYASLIKNNSDNIQLLINYAEVLAALGKKSEAMDLAVRAKALSSSNPMVRECYAMREFECGSDSAAIREFQEILRGNPNNERVRAACIVALNRDGAQLFKNRFFRLAGERFRAALKLDPHSKEALSGIELLKKHSKRPVKGTSKK